MKDQPIDLKELDLVKGTFTAEDAREILMSLISSKIAFHSKKNLSSFERSGRGDAGSEQRIEQLEQIRQHILGVLRKAKGEGRMVNIHSTIQVTVE